MKHTSIRGAAAAALLLAVAACSATPAQTSAATGAAVTAVVDAAACAADAPAIQGKTLQVALTIAADPNCVATLNAVVAVGTAASAVVTVQGVATAVSSP